MIKKISLTVTGILFSGAVLADPTPVKEMSANIGSDELAVQTISTKNKDKPDAAISSASSSNEPEVQFIISTLSSNEPEEELSSTLSIDEPEEELSSTLSIDEPEEGLSSTLSIDEPEAVISSTSNSDAPEAGIINSTLNSDSPEVGISSIVTSNEPLVEIDASSPGDKPAVKASTGDRSKWRAVFSASYLSINAQAAESQGLGSSGFSMEIAASREIRTNFIASLGLGILRFQDQDTFSQRVVNAFGSEEDATSSAGAIPVFGEIAYRRMLSSTSSMYYQIGTGYTAIMAADRGIANCLNCDSEEFDINGGMYLSASAGRSLSGGSSLGFTARQYMTGDLENGLMLWWKSK